MRKNVAAKSAPVFTHEGAVGKKFTPYQELSRAAMTCMLYENTFYESGDSIADRMAELVKKVDPAKVSDLAIKSRSEFYLRHVPLFLTRELARSKNGKIVEKTLDAVIQRPDELGEFLALYWSKSEEPLSNPVRRGLASAFAKFNAYELSKWDQNSAKVKLRDVLRLVHPKPKDAEQSATWKKLIAGELETADTWETQLSAGKDKKETFTRLLAEKKLGGMALLRNLRNMIGAGVSTDLIRGALETNPFNKVLPFRFLAAARHAPMLEPDIDKAMMRAKAEGVKLSGKTAILVDVSGSMGGKLSDKSDMTRMDAACGMAIVAAFSADQFAVATFSEGYVSVPPRQGMALRDAITSSQAHGGTNLGASLKQAYRHGFEDADRVIVITDEQSSDTVGAVGKNGQHRYIINVGSYEVGVADDGGWHRISGFSERIFDYIAAHEAAE